MSNASTYVIGIIMLVFIVAGGVALIGIAQSKDASFVDANKFAAFNKSFNQQDQVLLKIEGMKTNLTDAKPDFGLFGVLNGLIQTAWNVLTTMFSSFEFFTAMFTDMSTTFGLPIPTWVGSLIVALIVVVLIFAIFAAIFQRDV